jgi:hypothetical protein
MFVSQVFPRNEATHMTRGHCWLTKMTTEKIIVTMTANNIAAFDISVAFVIPFG